MKEKLLTNKLKNIILAGGLLVSGAACVDYKFQEDLLEKTVQEKFPVKYTCGAAANPSGASCGWEVITDLSNTITRTQRAEILTEATSYRQFLIDEKWGRARYVIDTLGSLALITSFLSIPFFFANRSNFEQDPERR